MIPTFPIVLPKGAFVIALDIEVECSMLRLEQPCGNLTNVIIMYPVESGRFGVLGYCDMCMDETPDEWHEELNQIQQRNIARVAAMLGVGAP